VLEVKIEAFLVDHFLQLEIHAQASTFNLAVDKKPGLKESRLPRPQMLGP